MEEQFKTWNFDDVAHRYDRLVRRERGIYAGYGRLLHRVAELAAVGPRRRALDLGMGTGNLSLQLLARGATVVGLDPSEAMLELARVKVGLNPRAVFLQSPQPFLTIPYADSSFDAVVSTLAFHHVPPKHKPVAVGEMMRVLRPGGRWVLGDLVFLDEAAERKALRRQRPALEEEYFTRVVEIRPLFAEHGIDLHAEQLTAVLWVLWGRRAG